MEITEIEANKDQRAFSLLLSVAEIERKMRDRLQDLGQNYNRKGFRPGRVPLGVLRRDFGPAVFRDILEAELQETSQEALKDSHRRPIGQPRIEAEDELSPDRDCRFRMEVDVMPEINGLEDLSWIKLDRLVPEILDKDIDRVLTDVAAKVGEPVELGDDQQAEHGDMLVVGFDASLDGKKIDSAHAEDYQIELGSKQMMDGFEDQLFGLAAGDEREFPITLPDDFGDAKLAGKTVNFSVVVKTVSRREPWPIDDELAKKQDFETLPLFRENIREHLRRDAEQGCRSLMRRGLLDQLYERYMFPAPQKLIDAEFATIQERVGRILSDTDAEAEQDSAHTDKDDEVSVVAEGESTAPPGGGSRSTKTGRWDSYREIATRRVCLALVLSEIGYRNHINLSEVDMRQAIGQAVLSGGIDPKQAVSFLRENPSAVQEIYAPAYEEKVVDFLFELGKSGKNLSPWTN